MSVRAVELHLGEVRDGHFGALKVSLVAESDGRSYVQIYAHDPTRGRLGTMLQLDRRGLDALREKLDEVVQTIERRPEMGALATSPTSG